MQNSLPSPYQSFYNVDMITGVITTRHILAHPIALIGAIGLMGYAGILLKCLDRQPHRFVRLYFETQREVKKTSYGK